jgi:hypothetical protein
MHAFLFLSFCNQCSFPKANPFSSDAWNDCINPLAGSLQPNQTKPNPSFLLHFSPPLGLLSLAEETPSPTLPFLFSFLSCATDDDLKQTNFGYMMRILGGIFFFIIGVILLDACDIISSQVLGSLLLVGIQLDGRKEGRKVMDDVLFRNFSMLP